MDIATLFLQYCDIVDETLAPQKGPVVREFVSSPGGTPRRNNTYREAPKRDIYTDIFKEEMNPDNRLSPEDLSDLLKDLELYDKILSAETEEVTVEQGSTQPAEVAVSDEGKGKEPEAEKEREVPIVVPDVEQLGGVGDAPRPEACPLDFQPVPEKIVLPEGRGTMPFFAWVPMYKEVGDDTAVAFDITRPVVPARLEEVRKNDARGGGEQGHAPKAMAMSPRSPVRSKKQMADAEKGHEVIGEVPDKPHDEDREKPSPGKSPMVVGEISLRPQTTLGSGVVYNKGKRPVNVGIQPHGGAIPPSPSARVSRKARFNEVAASNQPGAKKTLDYG